EQFDSMHIGAMYFVSNPDGTQTWSYGVGTATGAGAYHVDLLMPVGTHFGSAFDPSQISKPPYFYALDLSFGCTTGQATLSPRVGLSPRDILNLGRLTMPEGIAACTP